MAEDLTSLITGLGFPNIEAFLALMFLVLAIFGVVIVISTLRPVLSMFPYTYPNARIRARIGRIFDENSFKKLSKQAALKK